MDLTNLNNKDRKQRRRSSIDLNTMVYGKVPPQAKDLEEAVLGAVMLEKNAFDRIGLAHRYLRIAGDWRDHVLFQRVAE